MAEVETPITNRDFFTWMIGSYLIAGVFWVGMGLIVDMRWRQVLGATLVSGLILFGITLAGEKKESTDTPSRYGVKSK